MGDLHSAKCNFYTNFYIFNLKKILTLSAGCVKEKTIKIAFCTIFLAIFTFHATWINCPCQFTLEYLLHKGRY